METAAKMKTVEAIAVAYLANNSCDHHEIKDVIVAISAGIDAIITPVALEVIYKPAVNPKSSVKTDVIISLIDGQPYKMLKRHLGRNGLTPDDYRARYGLPKDYPMVAPAYAEKRRAIAVSSGLGRKA